MESQFQKLGPARLSLETIGMVERKGSVPPSSPSLLPIPSDETINFLAAIPALYTVYKNLHNRVNGPVGKNFHMEDSIRSRDGDMYTVKRRQI